MFTLNWELAFCLGKAFLSGLAQTILKTSLFNYESGYKEINEILLYGSENKAHMEEIGLNNLLCIYYMILHANKTVDVCVPSFESDTLANCLIKVHQNGNVKIRIVIHNSDDFHNLHFFSQNGIEVKIIKPFVRLEHEFLLIDASEKFKHAVAVIGSLDYNTWRVNCNRDATVLTSESTVVKALQREFNRVWDSVSDMRKPKNDIEKNK
ncbi:unnamed protein product [Arctia plantaginis]|uniref:Mitochondrial cardiolipin hydrolase n=1 Tax=Arctia plantaginis TaxID=874455 RepID=A0A8S1BDY1_ARCPL|nr:unnamed protein product [Arctia plantaginis]